MISSRVGGWWQRGKEEITGKEKWMSDGGAGGIPKPAAAHGCIFTTNCEHTHLSYIKAWQTPSRGQRGEIKHGSLCLRVRRRLWMVWQVGVGPEMCCVIRLRLLGTGAGVADTDSWWHAEETYQGWHGHCSHAQAAQNLIRQGAINGGLVNVKSGLRVLQP